MGYLYCKYQFNIVYIFIKFNRQGTARFLAYIDNFAM